MKRLLRPTLIPLALLTSLACASASVDSVQRYGADRMLPRPPVLLVYDFAISPTDALVDTYGSGYGKSSQPSNKDETKAKKLGASLSKQLVDKLNKKGVKARWASDTETPPLNGMNVVQEVTGGLDSDAGRLAEQLAKRAEGFYKRQGWL